MTTSIPDDGTGRYTMASNLSLRIVLDNDPDWHMHLTMQTEVRRDTYPNGKQYLHHTVNEKRTSLWL